MISFNKAFAAVLQTVCVGAIVFALIATNSKEINRSGGMFPAALVGVTITLLSGVTSLALAENNKLQ